MWIQRILDGNWREEDLITGLRCLSSLWKTLLGSDVSLGFNGGIVVEGIAKNAVIYKGVKTFSQTCSGEKLLALKTIEAIEKILGKLTLKQQEAIFWKLIDHSTIDGRPLNNEEIAKHIGIARSTFYDRLYGAWEKLGCDTMYLCIPTDFLV